MNNSNNQGGSRELDIGGALCSDNDVTMTSLLTTTPKYWWGKCPTCPTTDYLPGLDQKTSNIAHVPEAKFNHQKS